MVVTAFSGSSLLTAALAGIDQGKVDTSVSAILREISDRLSKEVSATWINWIILRTTIVLPGTCLKIILFEAFNRSIR